MSIISRAPPPIVGNTLPHFFLHVSTGNRKQLMEYVGKACATDFRRTSLPAQLASRPLQWPIAPLTLYGKYSNASCVEHPIAVGRPRYLSARASIWISNLSLTIALISSDHFVPKKRVDLSLLTNCPVPLLQVSKTSLSRSAPLFDALVKTIQSSAKRRCDTQGAWTPTRTPLEICTGPIPLSKQDKPSEHKRNR